MANLFRQTWSILTKRFHLIVLLAALMCAGCRTDAMSHDIAISKSDPRYQRLVPQGQPVVQGGFYDPTVEFTPDGTQGVLAYSALAGSAAWNFPIGPYIHTDLALSSDGGRGWRYATTVNTSIDGQVTLPNGKALTGVWRYEVPSLVYDVGDPARPWKLFAHRYFWSREKDRMPAFGWISMKSSTTPAGPWSEEDALFGSSRFPLSPYRARINVNALDNSLADAVAYTEPGAFYANSTLYLSLTVLGKSGPEKIILLASRDHGDSWAFRNTLVSNDDAKAIGYKKLDGSAIVEDQGRYYFLVSPEGRKALHEGTLVIEFEDLDRGLLKRNPEGRLAPRTIVNCQLAFMAKPGCGQADYHRHNVHGLILPQVNFQDRPEIFQLWQTGMRPGD